MSAKDKKESKTEEKVHEQNSEQGDFVVDFDVPVEEPKKKGEKKEKKPKKEKAKKEKKAKEEKPKKRKKKKHKKLIIFIVILLILFAIFVLPRLLAPKAAKEIVYLGDVYTVGIRAVEDTVSATGLVESHEDTTAKVYSTLTYKIDTVNVSVGDTVNEGDILCVYDTEALNRAIGEKELSMTTAEKNASLNLANAKLNYDSYREGINNGTNQNIVSAQSAYDTALENYDRAVADYDEYLAKMEGNEIVNLTAAKRDLDNAQKDYDDFKKEIDEGTNLQLRQAQRTLDTAKENYDDYKDLIDDNETPELLAAGANLDAAEAAYRAAADDLDALEEKMERLEDKYDAEASKEEPNQAKLDSIEREMDEVATDIAAAERKVDSLREAYYTAEDAYDNAHTTAEMTLETYETAYNNAQDNYDAVKKSLDDQLEVYANALARAEDAYNIALESCDDQLKAYERALTTSKRALDDATIALANAKTNSDNQLEGYRIAYQNAQNGTDTALADYQLANLYSDLEKTQVKAPISGTVTAVYAIEGEVASGVMFVIEDTKNLVVTSSVKAYNLDSVKEGMRVKIETDASGDEVFYGVIDSIAPTAKKDAMGNIVSTNDAEFETVVLIENETDALRIGVSAQLEYIVADEPQAIAIPESAIYVDAGESYVLLATYSVDEEGNENKEKLVLTPTKVEIGVDDGIYVSVKGIDEGSMVVDNVEKYKAFAGKTVSVSNVDPNATGFNSMMGMMMGGM